MVSDWESGDENNSFRFALGQFAQEIGYRKLTHTDVKDDISH